MQVNYKSVANCKSPKCAACEFEKFPRQSNKVNTIDNIPIKEQYLKKGHILPGHMVSTDNYISGDPVKIYHTKGKSDQSDMLSGVCVCIDHASGYVMIKHQVALNATETVNTKLTFDMEAQIQ